ncbi:hypothetical protein OAI02_06060 [Candidatus Pseudothioglobus singularis]|nr:hypothetical protein [Candidatus Pseudothioglobus singularis]MDB4848039.1 hypothetical protein [Candidatus Pseudothioglobus singularis]
MRKYLVSFLLSEGDRVYHQHTVGIEMKANDLKELFNLIGNDVEADKVTSERITRAVEGSGLTFDTYAPIQIGELNEYGEPILVWEDEDYRFNQESTNLH